MNYTLYTIMGLVALASYIIIGVRLMQLCNVSGVSLGWFSFIPFLAETRMARLAGANPWLVAIAIIPFFGTIVVIILGLVWLWRIATATDSKQWWWISLLGPLAIGLVSGLFGDSTTMGLLVTIIGLAVMTYARMMIFNPTKPIAAAQA